MRVVGFTQWALPLAAAVHGAHGLAPSEQAKTAPNGLPQSYIVEYTSGTTKRDVAGIHNDPKITVVDDYSSTLFTGASIRTDVYNLDALQAIPGVGRVWVNNLVKLAPITPQVFEAPQQVNYTTHNITGVTDVQNQGITGKGVKVGVVDSGTWYLHPALGGGFGPGYKVAGGWDFVGNGFWPTVGEKEPDADPLDQMGHGTHVAGIIAGKSEGFVGVAPDVTIHSYKVFAQVDSTDDATLVDAFLRAYADGMDIITSSIGGPSNWEDNAWAVVASRLVEQGVIVTISAGNDGRTGPMVIGNGGAGKNVLAIASTETEVQPLFPYGLTVRDRSNTTANTTTFGYIPATDLFPKTVVGWPIKPLTLNASTENDGCAPWPETLNLTGVIPLIRRGGCNFSVKQAYAEERGAKYTLVYNSGGALITPSTTDTNGLLGIIPAAQGASIISVYADGGSVTADFSEGASANPVGGEDALANTPSDFTSWGPLYDLSLKPDIAAPGGNIYSTYPNDSWAIISGTSMACPFVAGVAALYVEHAGHRGGNADYALEFADRVVSTGAAVSWSDGETVRRGYSASVAQVGNGLVDAYKLINYGTTLRYDKLELNDTRYFSRYHEITVTNGGSQPQTYTLSSEPAAGIDILLESGGGAKAVRTLAQLEPIDLEPKVYLPSGFTLEAGESKTVSVNFDNPDKLGWDASLLPLYSGKIYVTSSAGEVLSVPYLGLGADLKRQLAHIDAAGYPTGVSGVDQVDLKEDSSFSFNLSVASQDFPAIYTDFLWGSREVRWDIYEHGWSERDWTYPPVEGENGYIGPATYWYDMESVDHFDPSTQNPNDTVTYPYTDITHGLWQFWWFGKLGNGSKIANGKYTWRFATLLPFGNPTHADNWEVYEVRDFAVTGHY